MFIFKMKNIFNRVYNAVTFTADIVNEFADDQVRHLMES